MADRIEAIGRVSYNISKIQPVSRYTQEQAEKLMKSVEKESSERQEINNYLKKYSANPDHLSFAELLKQALDE